MLSRLNKKTVGALLVLVGLFIAVGFVGSSDIGAMPFLKAALGAIGSIGLMGAGALLIGGEADEDTI